LWSTIHCLMKRSTDDSIALSMRLQRERMAGALARELA
jgi:hypothetical protein